MYLLIILLPLIGTLFAMPLRIYISARATEIFTTSLVFISSFLSWILFINLIVGNTYDDIVFFTWLSSGDLLVNWSLKIDMLTSVMLVVVTTVSALVHLYSIGYMHEDPERGRFFLCLSLFTFAMLVLVSADNFGQLFFGWEGVGLASYLLIGFWRHKKSANDAAIKAFVVNRVGDFGFVLGIAVIFYVFRDLGYDNVFNIVKNNLEVLPYGYETPVKIWELKIDIYFMEVNALCLIAFLLFIGAMGKSAQFTFHTWLPDAMEGPTPVSALIHAATMVTAGVFLVARASPIFEHAEGVKNFVLLVGAITAIFAASVALFQNDIKKIIAYSTCSQLGYMFVACGVGAYDIAIFHLFTHAFFKAMLFLCAGIVIVGTHHEQDIKKMGGVRHLFPLTYIFMLIGTAAITGVGIPFLKIFGAPIGFAGFVSKDLIIEYAFLAYETNKYALFAFAMTSIAAVLTAFYSWRLICITFVGKSRLKEEVKLHPHVIPSTMIYALIPLALGSVFAGSVFYKSFSGSLKDDFWKDALYFAKEDTNSYTSSHATKKDGSDDSINIDEYLNGQIYGVGAENETLPDEQGAVASDIDNHSNNVATDHAQDSHAALDNEHADESHKSGHHDIPFWVILTPFFAMIIGSFFAISHYRDNEVNTKNEKKGLISQENFLYKFLSNKWYFDELYQIIFVRPVYFISEKFWKIIDIKIIDNLGPNGISFLINKFSKRFVKIQTGYIFHYAFGILLGILMLLVIVWINFFKGI